MLGQAKKTVTSNQNRPSTPIIVGIDIGGTKIATAIADTTGRLIATCRIATEVEQGPERIIGRIVDSVHQLLRDSGAAQAAAIGVGCGGPLDPDAGVILSPPNLPGWDAVPLKRILEDEFGVETYVDNDANAAALGEHLFGAGVGARTMIYVTVSTGIGGGIIVDGHLLHGVRASAGEIGHQTVIVDGPRCNCGNRGCLEALASGTAIARRAREALATNPNSLMVALAGGQIDSVTAQTVVQAVRENDELALKIWGDTIEYLSVGLANVIATLAPEVVVIGGGVSEAGDMLFPPLRRSVAARVFVVPMDRVRIVPAKLGAEVGVIGAVAVALQRLEREP